MICFLSVHTCIFIIHQEESSSHTNLCAAIGHNRHLNMINCSSLFAFSSIYLLWSNQSIEQRLVEKNEQSITATVPPIRRCSFHSWAPLPPIESPKSTHLSPGRSLHWWWSCSGNCLGLCGLHSIHWVHGWAHKWTRQSEEQWHEGAHGEPNYASPGWILPSSWKGRGGKFHWRKAPEIQGMNLSIPNFLSYTFFY